MQQNMHVRVYAAVILQLHTLSGIILGKYRELDCMLSYQYFLRYRHVLVFST